MAANETQIGGEHYRNKMYQPWDVMRDWMTAEQYSGFLLGCIIKYVSRYRDKAGVEDLKKARHFLDKIIEAESEVSLSEEPKTLTHKLVVPRCECKDTYTYEIGSSRLCPVHHT